MKKVGILLPIFSLPSKYGIGDFGYEAYEFIDILNENKIDYWEILPINATQKFPYSPVSYYALNEEYISIDKLVDMNLLQKSELNELPRTNRVVYNNLKEKYYKKAYSRFKSTEEFENFKSNIKICQYAEYINKKSGENIEYTFFLQYILDKQWKELKKYANKKNIKIIGDMPIYPAFESAEVLYNPQCFQLENGKMEYVSGVAPDNQYPDGQVWGNPVYDYKYLENNNYKYLLERYDEFLRRFDIVRIDHFIGYDVYYKIPNKQNAINGVYEQGPQYSFFDKLLKIASKDRFIVEDLGLVRESTIKLREHYGFMGSNIAPFSINLDKMDDIFFNKENIAVYTGTHDCNTIVGWYETLSMENKIKLIVFLKKNGCYNVNIHQAFIQYCLKSKANMVIIPVQDILGLGAEARINVPGKNLEENWTWKLVDFNDFRQKCKILR